MAFAMPLTTSICYTPLDGASFSKPKHTILIYGATSYTARLLIDYLATHPERKQFTFALAGRNPEKLKKLVDELHQANEDGEEGKTEWIACALEDTIEGYPKVAAMVSDAEVVINLAGRSWENPDSAGQRKFDELCTQGLILATMRNCWFERAPSSDVTTST